MSINTVIFDFGCVLSVVPRPEDFAPLRAAIGVLDGSFEEIYWRQRDAYDRDDLDAQAYWEGVARAAGTVFAPEKVQQLVSLDCQVWERPNPVMMEWVAVLRARGLRTAILSNMSRPVSSYLRRTAPWTRRFDYLCFSGEHHMAKPDLSFYRLCLDGVGVRAEDALFVDDREVNLVAARSLGMPCILFTGVEKLLADLEPYRLTESLEEARRHARQTAPGV